MRAKRGWRRTLAKPQWVPVALAVTALSAGSIGLVASPASATGKGSVHIVEWCHSLNWNGHPMTYDNINAYPTDSKNPYSWLCSDSTIGVIIGIDMNAACAYWYGKPGHAVLGNKSDAYSWYCA